MSDDLDELLKCLRGQRIPVTADQLRLAATTIETQIGTIGQLRGNLSLAEEGLANAMQENAELKAQLERIQQARLTWAMACECQCCACTGLDKLIRGTEHPERMGLDRY